MSLISSEFYGDNVRWFMGVVEEVGNDNPKLGRVKVRIYGIHGTRDQIPNEDLPLAQVLVPTTEGGVSGIGRNPQILPGATVFGIFLDGKDSQLPLVLGSIPVVEVPSIEQMNEESQSPEDENQIKKLNGSIFGGVPGVGTNGSAGIRSALRQGLDGYVDVPETENLSKVSLAWEWFSKSGKFTPPVIAGIIGNLLVDSGKGNPIDIDPYYQSDNIVGINAWSLPTLRGRGLRQFAERNDKLITDLWIQLAYIEYELFNNPRLKGAELLRQKTPTTAAIHFQRYYKQPGFSDPIALSPIDGEKMQLGELERVQFAKAVYNLFTRKPLE